MRYVNCARYLEEQNLVSVQKDMEMYYKAIKVTNENVIEIQLLWQQMIFSISKNMDVNEQERLHVSNGTLLETN